MLNILVLHRNLKTLKNYIMKKLLLATMAALTVLFTQAQITPCDSLVINGSQFKQQSQLILVYYHL